MREKSKVQRGKSHLKRNTHASAERDKWAKNTYRLEEEKIPSCYRTRLLTISMKSRNHGITASQNG